MWLSERETEKISRSVIKQLKAAGVKLSDEGGVASVIANTINQNIEDERRLEDDALKLLKQHRAASGAELDQERALQMIKKKLADERKFVL